MATTLLTDEPVTLYKLPLLSDIESMSLLLERLGTKIDLDEKSKKITLTSNNIENQKAPYDIVRKMRASILVLGPLVARYGRAKVSLPGGCAIGARPVDFHLKALEALGAEIELKDGYVFAKAPGGLKGGTIHFSKVSVGATENALMAATLAKGTTKIVNAAQEPEITDLIQCLKSMGAHIEGEGTSILTVEGKNTLSGTTHHIISDRIETGTYAMAALITDGDIELHDAYYDENDAVTHTLIKSGAKFVKNGGTYVRVKRQNAHLNGLDITTEPYPGFPTDLQAQIMAMLSVSEGASMITETIFENRFMHIPELLRMGADISLNGSSAVVKGVKKLKGAPVMATDLRASVSLLLAGLVAEGQTTLNRIYHLDRGYENVEEKLASCGASIERVPADI